jgi:hypothetical protein
MNLGVELVAEGCHRPRFVPTAPAQPPDLVGMGCNQAAQQESFETSALEVWGTRFTASCKGGRAATCGRGW